jgi:hypothetical protein
MNFQITLPVTRNPRKREAACPYRGCRTKFQNARFVKENARTSLAGLLNACECLLSFHVISTAHSPNKIPYE